MTASSEPRSKAALFHDVAQGLFAIAGILAILGGAWLYRVERRDKPRIILTPAATVVPISASGEPKSVLLQVRFAIENRSSTALVFSCAAIDLFGLTGQERSSPLYADDLQGVSLLPVPGTFSLRTETKATERFRRCVETFERERIEQEQSRLQDDLRDRRYVNPPEPGAAARSGARYRDFLMEPGETTVKSYELQVPCGYTAVRAIFKLPKPDSTFDYEVKTMIPIANVCSPQANVSILRFDEQDEPAETAAVEGGGAAAAPNGKVANAP
jgi:hypothetical protein